MEAIIRLEAGQELIKGKITKEIDTEYWMGEFEAMTVEVSGRKIQRLNENGLIEELKLNKCGYYIWEVINRNIKVITRSVGTGI